MPTSELKGHGFISGIAALDRITTPERVAKILDHAPRVKAMHQKKEFVSSGWYPLELYAEFTKAVRDELGPQASAQLGRETTIADINSLFRFVLHLFTPQSLAKFAPRIFRTYCRGPEAVLEESTPKTMQCTFSNFEGCTQAIYEEFMSGTATFVELGGGKGCRFEVVEGGKDGDTFVRFKLTWD